MRGSPIALAGAMARAFRVLLDLRTYRSTSWSINQETEARGALGAHKRAGAEGRDDQEDGNSWRCCLVPETQALERPFPLEKSQRMPALKPFRLESKRWRQV
jgi:hypothetical protein